MTGAVVLTAATLAWEGLVRLLEVPVWIVPAPSAIAAALWRDLPGLAVAAGITLSEALAGLVLGGVVGVCAAVVVTLVPRLEQAVMSLALLIKSTPIIAVAPILAIWFGFGHTPKVLVTSLLTFFPVLVYALDGFRSLDSAVIDWMDSVDASKWATFRHGRWPGSRPHLFAALKVAAPLAMIGAVVAEWMGAADGLGREMWLAYTNLRMPELFAAVMVLTVLSASVYHGVTLWERHAMRWRPADPSRA